jgi:hypothetical protein
MPVDELAALLRVVTLIADLDPATAWELDAQLEGLTKVSAAFAEGLATWGETLAAIKLDDSVTAAAATGSDHLSQTATAFAKARKNLRTVYAAQFAAAEAQVSQVDRREFWGETPHPGPGPGTGPSAGPSSPPADDEPTGEATEVQPGAMHLPDGAYLDWSSNDDGGRSFEVGDGTTPDATAVALDLTPEQLRELRDQLSLTLAGDHGAADYIGLDSDNSSYIDWSTPRPDGGRQIEISDAAGNAVSIDLSRDDLQALHDQLADDLGAEQGTGEQVPAPPPPGPASVEDRVLAAYDDLVSRPGGTVSLAVLREGLSSVSRDDLDQALLALDEARLIQLEPDPDRAGLTAEDRAATVTLGGREKHLLRRVVEVEEVVAAPPPAEPGRSSEPIRWPNGAEGVDQGLMHFDSALGALWNRLGDDQHLQVDGHALGNLITDLGEGITRGKHDTNHALGELRRIRTQLPDGSKAARQVDAAIGRLDAPDRPAPTLPGNTPQQLKDLMADLHAINLVRRGYDVGNHELTPVHETDQLAEITRRWMSGEIGRSTLERDLGSLIHYRHESSEGWTEIREAVARALRDFREWARTRPT